jgi:hypothetical protein
MQGSPMQRSGAVSHRLPSVPDGQAQKKSPSRLMQLALFKHGWDSQKLRSFSHLCPVHPRKILNLEKCKSEFDTTKFK